MNKKLFSLFVIAALLCSGAAFAITPASNPGTVYQQASGQTLGTPVTVVIPVRYGRCGDANKVGYVGLSSGDVVVWDTSSADGVTVSASIVTGAVSYAGVLVTALATADNGSIDPNDKNWGYMAIKGYCLAKVDTSNATSGKQLIPTIDLAGAFGTYTDISVAGNTQISTDIGILLKDTGSDGLMPVILKW